MTFEKGVPVSVNGKKMKVSDIIRELNTLGGKHGIGIIDIVENRVVGMKSRGVYETPGGTILMEAHEQLEELVLDRATMEVKKDMGNKLAQIVYEGKWFTPLCDAIKAFVKSTQEYVTKSPLFFGNQSIFPPHFHVSEAESASWVMSLVPTQVRAQEKATKQPLRVRISLLSGLQLL